MLASLNKLRLSDYTWEMRVSKTVELGSGLRESMAVNKDLCREQHEAEGQGLLGLELAVLRRTIKLPILELNCRTEIASQGCSDPSLTSAQCSFPPCVCDVCEGYFFHCLSLSLF